MSSWAATVPTTAAPSPGTPAQEEEEDQEDIMTAPAAEAHQYRDQRRVTTSVPRTVPPTPPMQRVRSSATVLMKMVG